MIEKPHQGVIAFTKACFDYSQIYPADNPSVMRQFGFLHRTCESMIERDGGLNIEVNAQYLMVNGQYIEPKNLNKTVIEWFVGHCMERKISEISVSNGVSKRELESFIQLFKTDPQLFINDSVANRILVPAGVEHIQINPSRIDDSFTSARPLATAAPKPETVTQTEIQRMFEPDLFISVDSGATLKAQVEEQLDKKEIWKVADFMANMKRHFGSTSPDVRRLALSRYRIVIESVIAHGLDEVIHSVYKAIPGDLEAFGDDESFNLHLRSFCLLLDRYLEKQLYPAIIFGFHTLAGFAQSRIQTESELMLQERLTPELLSDLFKAKNADPRLDRNIKIMFFEHPHVICRSLLHHLGVSEDKQERRTVLNILSAMGVSIHEQLLASLREAISDKSPWYLRRNLLFILAASPPAELTPIIKQLLSDSLHAKVADQTYRCLFALQDPELVGKGQQLIESAPRTSTLSTFINIIASNQNAAYGETLVELANRHNDERIVSQAMAALGKMGSGPALTYLTHVIQETSLLSKFRSTSRRISAAQALLNSGHRTLIAALARQINDKDDRVAQLAKQAKKLTK